MKTATLALTAIILIAPPASAIDFLGVELCMGSTDAAVDLPPGSSLVIESAEIGDNGGLVVLFSARSGKVMNHVDDLMTGLTGQRGKGDVDTLEWTGERVTGVAQRVAKKYAALAVASTDECSGAEPVPVPVPTAVEVESTATAAAMKTAVETPPPEPDPAPMPAAAAAVVAAAASNAPPRPAPEPAVTTPPDFEVIGAISHEAADPTWVDVMGVVANHTASGYKLATFDLSFFGADGRLICVDTISVSVLKTGQERAFRDAIRCPGYDPADVAETRLQFAGGF